MTRSGLRASRRFWTLWSGYLFGATADQLLPIVLIVLALDASGLAPATALSLVFAARFGGLALFIILGGVLADRVDRYRFMALINLLRIATVGALFLTPAPTPMAVLALAAFVMASLEGMFSPCYNSLIPELVDDRALEAANSATSLLRNTAAICGPAAAGVVVAWVGPKAALVAALALFAASAGCVVAARATAGSVERRAGSAGRPGDLVRDAWSGVALVARIPWLAALQVMAALHTLLAVAPWYVLTPLIAVDLPGGVGTYGLLLTSFGIGGLLGALIAGRFKPRLPGIWSLAAISLFAVPCFLLTVTTETAVLLAGFAVAGAGTQFFDVYKITAIQREIPSTHLGRAMSLDYFVSFVTIPFGQLITAAVIVGISYDTVLIFAGVLVLTTSLLPLLIPGVARLRASETAARGADEPAR